MLISEECESYIREKTTSCLLEIGVPANLQGFKYMRDAILYIVRDPRYKRGVTKRLYPMIADKYEVSVSVVERAIRHAIEVACTRGTIATINRMFKINYYDSDYKPTISELISLLSERILSFAKDFELRKQGY